MRALLKVFAKEFLENLRDRRTLISALVFGPLFGPILFGAMVSRMLNQSLVESDEPLKITLSGAEHAPNLVSFLESHGVTLVFTALTEAAARVTVKRGTTAVVLIVPDDYAPRFAAALPAPLLLVADSSDSQTRKIAERLRALLGGYGSGIAQLRLQVRGVDPLLAVPVAVNEIDVTTPAGRAVVVLGFMTYFVLFSVLMGGLYLAIDSTAGERERGAVEPARGAQRAGRRQDSRHLRLYVPVARHQSHRIRVRIPIRAARAAGDERESRRGYCAGVLRHLPAVRALGCRADDLRGLLHPQLSGGTDVFDERAAGADASHSIRQHLLA